MYHIPLVFIICLWHVCWAKTKSKCLGPPYLLLTVHHEFPNVLKYTRDGCLLSTTVLKGGHISTPENPLYTEFRSIAVGSYQDKEDVLYVNVATTKDSHVMVYGNCSAEDGSREYLDTVVSTQINTGANHAYGLTFDDAGNVYASFQHTDVVLRFVKDTFEPMTLPPTLRDDHKWWSFYPGTFYQFGEPKEHKNKEQGIRSIVHVNGEIWIANEDINGVAVVDAVTGQINSIVVIHRPIGLYYDEANDKVFVSSRKKHWGGAIYAVDPNYLRVTKVYHTHRTNHPTGVVTYRDTLFVAIQDSGVVVSFNLTTAESLGTVIKDTGGVPEQLALSNC